MKPATEERYVPRRGVEARIIDGGAVLVDMGSGKVFELNRIGAEIWKLLGPGATVTAICETLIPRYKIERAELESDVEKLVDSLIRAGLAAVQKTGTDPSVSDETMTWPSR